MSVTHATTATGTDAGTGDIHKAEWNASHLITPSYLGYNTVGASTESITSQRMNAKQITAGSDGNVLLGIGAYIDYTGEAVAQFGFALFADSGSNTIGDMIEIVFGGANIVLAHGTGGGVSFPARWFHIPITYALDASTKYWIGFWWNGGAAAPRIYYDTGGSDRYYAAGVTPYWYDGQYTGVGSQTDSTRKYSLRALVL